VMTYKKLKQISQLQSLNSLSPDTDIFQYHFPGNPLLPGAFSALLLSYVCGGTDWTLRKIEGLRFRKPLTPDLSFSIACEVKQETSDEKVCVGKISSGEDAIADGEFTFFKGVFPKTTGARLDIGKIFWNEAQVRTYLPHAAPIVLIDQLISVEYPAEVQSLIASNNLAQLEQSKLTGTKIHTRSKLAADGYWINEGILPSPILSELAAQAGALTLAPFFSGTKPQVALLGCDTEYFSTAEEGSTIDTFVELKRVKRLGKLSNMILFKCECHIGDKKIAQVNLNAMASF